MAQLNINNLLKQYNFTQKDLAECTKINKNTISKYCNNTFESINKEHIDLLCKFFNCTPNDLFEIDTTVEVSSPPSKLIGGGVAGATVGFALGGLVGGIVGTAIGMAKEEHTSGLRWFNPFTWGISETDATITHEMDVSKEQSIEMRLSFEMSINWEISEFINKLIEYFTSSHSIDEKIEKVFKNYLDDDDIFAVNSKLEKYSLPLSYLLIQYPLKGEIFSFLTYLRNIYSHGGLTKLSDDDLNSIMTTVRYYNDHDFIEK